MKTLVLILIMFCSAQLYAGTINNKLQAQDETIEQLLGEIKGLKTECEPGPITCVPKCSSRSNDGECRIYEADFCGRRANCAQKCISRNNEGDCRIYGADVCGPDMACAQKCNSRNSSGECRIYGEDVCGSNISCTENCTSRNSAGECRIYGPDICR